MKKIHGAHRAIYSLTKHKQNPRDLLDFPQPHFNSVVQDLDEELKIFFRSVIWLAEHSTKRLKCLQDENYLHV